MDRVVTAWRGASRAGAARAGWLGAAAALALLLPSAAAAAGDAAAGKETYQTFCVTCHGPGGKGDGPAAPKDPAPRDFTKGDFKYDADGNGTPGEDADLAMVIKNGAAQYGGSPMMAPWGHLSDEQIQDLVAYIRSLEQG